MSSTVSISVLTASTRPDGLPMVADCLGKQTLPPAEWLVCVPPGTKAPADLVAYLRRCVPNVRFLSDPPKRPGDFYRLNGAWNKLVAAASSPLLVFAVDWIWFEADALERMASVYASGPLAGVCSTGNHFRKVINGRPEVLWEQDGRSDRLAATPGWDGCTLLPEWMEMSLSSLPRSQILAVGGFDEDYDAGAGNSEKELALRMAAAGSVFYLAEAIPHRIYTHPKESSVAQWDAAYAVSSALLRRHAAEIEAGTRRTLARPVAA